MKNLLMVLAVLVLTSIGFGATLQYDTHPTPDGGISANERYRGVWFDVHDFYPECNSFDVTSIERYFYNSPSSPWGSPTFHLYVYDCVPPIPPIPPISPYGEDAIIHVQGSAMNYPTPTVLNLNPALNVEAEFWVIIYTESTGPTPVLENCQTNPAHSYWGDVDPVNPDIMDWEPCNNFWIRVMGDYKFSLSSTTWGSIKALF